MWGMGRVCCVSSCLRGFLSVCSWRFLFYLCSFIGGLSVLYHVSVLTASCPSTCPTSTYYVLGLAWG